MPSELLRMTGAVDARNMSIGRQLALQKIVTRGGFKEELPVVGCGISKSKGAKLTIRAADLGLQTCLEHFLELGLNNTEQVQALRCGVFNGSARLRRRISWICWSQLLGCSACLTALC